MNARGFKITPDERRRLKEASDAARQRMGLAPVPSGEVVIPGAALEAVRYRAIESMARAQYDGGGYAPSLTKGWDDAPASERAPFLRGATRMLDALIAAGWTPPEVGNGHE